MKNQFVLCILGVLMSRNVLGALPEKKPTLMILPGDHWCQTRFFMTTWDNQGVKVKTADYQKAFQQDSSQRPQRICFSLNSHMRCIRFWLPVEPPRAFRGRGFANLKTYQCFRVFYCTVVPTAISNPFLRMFFEALTSRL